MSRYREFITASLILGASVVQCAVNPNGARVVVPVGDDGASPIADIKTYDPDRHDCPLPCAHLDNVHTWVTYLSVDRLRRCQQPTPLQLSATQRLSGDMLIRVCTFGGAGGGEPIITSNTNLTCTITEASKPSLNRAPACGVLPGGEVMKTLPVSTNSSADGDGADNVGDATRLLEAMSAYFSATDSCNEMLLFGYHKQTVAGVFIRAGLRKIDGRVPNRLVMQLCKADKPSSGVFGGVVENKGDLAAVKQTAADWQAGMCAAGDSLVPSGELKDEAVLDIVELHNKNGTLSNNAILFSNTILARKCMAILPRQNKLQGSDFGSYIQVLGGDTCTSLAFRCGIGGSQFTTHNPNALQPNHFLGLQYDLTEEEIEGFNKGKTPGNPPLLPPQEGAQCGPLVPGTTQPTDGTSMVDLNPCPLKACCSNWGFCGPFPEHCDIHAPEGGSPGTKLPGLQSTCISNCGNEIKQNSGPPAAFSLVGYYESWNMGRHCLWLRADKANTDGTYTHWGFAEIDPNTWKPVITNPHSQWDAFKKLELKRILSFRGWAYSTEPATYNIIRRRLLRPILPSSARMRALMYPGAPDIMVDGKAIGQTGDGVAYLRFLTSLKQKLGTDKSVSIAAPASHWYLKAFPIDRISAVIDYNVYMTYDLHGQWDYGNVNAFNSCPSGKCIRSHVNLTETRNTLSIMTKADVANNKVMVGESDYGRSFHMAVDGCWSPLCVFMGTRTESDANPGRCTATKGYISNAEINELITQGSYSLLFHDGDSNTDVLLYKGDYVSYMTQVTKLTRRDEWKTLNFGGSIDSAVDLQTFGDDDMKVPINRGGDTGDEGCVSGEDKTANSGDLCKFTFCLGFCPESLCECVTRGEMLTIPPENPVEGDIIAWNEVDIDLNRLCRFACSHGYCPYEVCATAVVDKDEDDGIIEAGWSPENPNYFNYTEARLANANRCLIYQNARLRDEAQFQCDPYCKPTLDEAKEKGRTSNYDRVGFFSTKEYLDGITWDKYPGTSYYVAPGTCSCDNMLINEIADTVLEALPIIAQIGCYVLMSSLRLVLDVGASLILGVGKILDAGLDIATTAAQMAAPCGGTDLVPEEIKEIFGILSSVADGVSSFVKPEASKGSGQKGDDAKPTDRSKHKVGTGSGPNVMGKTQPGSGGIRKKCNVPKSQSTLRLEAAKNTMRRQSWIASKTQKEELIITSLTYGARATQVQATCYAQWSQTCYHYSSVIRNNQAWATITCPQAAATTAHRQGAQATATWSSQHRGFGWTRNLNGQWKACDRDEYPPADLLAASSPAVINSGIDRTGQLVRYIPDKDDRKAGQMWKGAYFASTLKELSGADFDTAVSQAPNSVKSVNRPKTGLLRTYVGVGVNTHPEFTISSHGHSGNPPANDGLNDNKCWPSGIAVPDTGFALLMYDPYYDTHPMP
ncbi:Killer toxin subunits alpha/beta [Colletotrichum gloeosporioides]|uniref:chitinase n=1 Tax=Colletotrichum gloeosporioides TaxID=474922 RepID=A0A8H4CF82_COLGL|nr:Killer toxin subunits alpha/beta [Colletotrichum gloeosporioides]KAF3802950.1 Killer toxin subunits alpha/beta [Colletotrichum gloeosporioides]